MRDAEQVLREAASSAQGDMSNVARSIKLEAEAECLNTSTSTSEAEAILKTASLPSAVHAELFRENNSHIPNDHPLLDAFEGLMPSLNGHSELDGLDELKIAMLQATSQCEAESQNVLEPEKNKNRTATYASRPQKPVKTGFCGRFGHRSDCRCHLKHRLFMTNEDGKLVAISGDEDGYPSKSCSSHVVDPNCTACLRPSMKMKHTCPRGISTSRKNPPVAALQCAACSRPSLKTKHTCSRGRVKVSRKHNTRELGAGSGSLQNAGNGDLAMSRVGTTPSQSAENKVGY